MKFKNIHFILNPMAGSEEPVLSYINKVLCGTQINWEISVTKKNRSAFDIAGSVSPETDLVAVYGGDGSVSDTARALYGKNIPMAIIPGGTANVMAKELKVPLDTLEAITLLANGRNKVVKIDMGMANTTPFMLRINLGIMADMIVQADPDLKRKLGQLAYGVSGFSSLVNAEPVNLRMVIDGEKISEPAVALTVTNAASLGISSFSLLPGISLDDGLLDVILMPDNDVLSVLRIAGSTLVQSDSEMLKHWKCKTIDIRADAYFSFICDDTVKRAKRLRIKVIPKSLHIVVPT
jgi:YegS/Rv2252/BmrU family lipid kinase